MRTIRTATMQDLDVIARIEEACFPAAEAASRQSFAERLKFYPNHFWLLEEDGEIISFVNGMATDEPDLKDEMYENAAMHDESGAWQMIFGVNTLPKHRKKGCAGELLERAIEDAKNQRRSGLVLTCKEPLIHYYAKFGFLDEGLSRSTHGGVVWHQMRLCF